MHQNQPPCRLAHRYREAAAAACLLLTQIAGAQCPVPPDALAESATLTASDPDAHDLFGQSVALDGDVALIGVLQDDELDINEGAAHVYRFNGVSWNEEARLLADEINGIFPNFGAAVALNQGVAIVGAPQWRHTSPEGDVRSLVGRIFIYRFDGAGWPLEAAITPELARSGDGFGSAVALDGAVAAVGAPLDDDLCAETMPPDWDVFDTGCFQNCDSGAVYIYRFDGSQWTQSAKIKAADAQVVDRFGSSVALSGDVLAVGAPIADDPTRPFCDVFGSSVPNGSGAVYVYRFDGSAWVQEARLTPPDPQVFDNFGRSIALRGDVLAIGAPNADGGGSVNAGSVFVYRYNGATWNLESTLVHSDVQRFDRIGQSVALDGDLLVSGAFESDDACEADEFCNSGSAYVFRHDTTGWTEQAKLVPTDARRDDRFGFALALSGGRLLAGVPLHEDGVVCCPCETDGQPGVGVFDLLGYLSLWFGNAGRADFNHNLTVDVFDLLDYLSCWFPASNGDCGPVPLDCESGAAYVFEGLADCNGNGVPEACDLAAGNVLDADGNGVPDTCEP